MPPFFPFLEPTPVVFSGSPSATRVPCASRVARAGLGHSELCQLGLHVIQLLAELCQREVQRAPLAPKKRIRPRWEARQQNEV